MNNKRKKTLFHVYERLAVFASLLHLTKGRLLSKPSLSRYLQSKRIFLRLSFGRTAK
jgi:hypothetical protein